MVLEVLVLESVHVVEIPQSVCIHVDKNNCLKHQIFQIILVIKDIAQIFICIV